MRRILRRLTFEQWLCLATGLLGIIAYVLALANVGRFQDLGILPGWVMPAGIAALLVGLATLATFARWRR